MLLINFNTSWGDKKNSTMMFVEDFNDPELFTDDINRASCPAMDNLADKYGYDEKAYKALGADSRDRFPVILAVECKPGWMENFSRYYCVGGAWINKNDTAAFREMYVASTKSSKAVTWDETGAANAKMEREIQRAIEHFEKYTLKDCNKYMEKLAAGLKYETITHHYIYTGEDSKQLEVEFCVRDYVREIAADVYDHYTPWKVGYEAVKMTHPEIIEILEQHGIKNRKDYRLRNEGKHPTLRVPAHHENGYADTVLDGTLDEEKLFAMYDEFLASIGQD